MDRYEIVWLLFVAIICLFLPNAVQYIPIWIYSDINIWDDNLVLFGFLFIPKESVRHPNF